MKGIADTGFLVAFANANDKHHRWAAQLARMADRFSEQKPDIADLCLVRMSELFPRHSVVTIDRKDFQIYRRNKREAVPLLCPPER
ncbi:MAG: hypothetical protein WB440_07325 [Steroidobacteraceae bacterium]